jgi:hypothetical protein
MKEIKAYHHNIYLKLMNRYISEGNISVAGSFTNQLQA